MKLWLLRPVDNDPAWVPWYDKAFGFVIRAETEREARLIADQKGGSERLNRSGDWRRSLEIWTNPARASCVELLAEGTEGLIIVDFASA